MDSPMTTDRSGSTPEILDPESTGAQSAYTPWKVQVRNEALKFAHAIQLGNEATASLLGLVHLRLEESGEDNAREVAQQFGNLSEYLGGQAVSREVLIDQSSLVDEVGFQSIGEGSQGAESLLSRPYRDPESVNDKEKDPRTVTLLTSTQRTWFSKFLSEADVERISNLPDVYKESFVSALISRYQDSEFPALRTYGLAELDGFLQGKSYPELTAVSGAARTSVQKRVTGVALNIRKLFSEDELRSLIEHREELAALEVGAESFTKLTPLNKSQLNWLNKVLPGETPAIERLGKLSVDARVEFAKKLGEMYVNLRGKGLTPERQKLRANELVALFEGKTYREIGGLNGLDRSSVQERLQRMAKTLRQEVDSSEVIKLIPGAKPVQLIEDDIRAVTEASAEELSEEELSATQANLYKGLFEIDTPEGQQFFARLSERQKNYLSELISDRIKEYFRKDSDFKINRRIEEVRLIIQGKSLKEISKKVGLPQDNLIKEIYQSTAKFYERTTPAERVALLNSVKEASLLGKRI